jgi:hypothetical protein
MDAFDQIETKIKIAADAVAQSIAAGDDSIATAVIGRNTNAYLLINSSFLFRDASVKTNQSPRRLLVQVTANGQRIRREPLRSQMMKPSPKTTNSLHVRPLLD